MRPRRPVDATLWQPPRVPHGGDPTGRRRALGRGTHVRTRSDHSGAFVGVGLGQSSGPSVTQRRQCLHVPQQSGGTPVPGNQRSTHENCIGLYLLRTS